MSSRMVYYYLWLVNQLWEDYVIVFYSRAHLQYPLHSLFMCRYLSLGLIVWHHYRYLCLLHIILLERFTPSYIWQQCLKFHEQGPSEYIYKHTKAWLHWYNAYTVKCTCCYVGRSTEVTKRPKIYIDQEYTSEPTKSNHIKKASAQFIFIISHLVTQTEEGKSSQSCRQNVSNP